MQYQLQQNNNNAIQERPAARNKELTRELLMEMYGVSRTTLWRWFRDYDVYEKVGINPRLTVKVFTPKQFSQITQIFG